MKILYTAMIGYRAVDSSCDFLPDRRDTTYHALKLKLLCTLVGTGIVVMLGYFRIRHIQCCNHTI